MELHRDYLNNKEKITTIANDSNIGSFFLIIDLILTLVEYMKHSHLQNTKP